MCRGMCLDVFICCSKCDYKIWFFFTTFIFSVFLVRSKCLCRIILCIAKLPAIELLSFRCTCRCCCRSNICLVCVGKRIFPDNCFIRIYIPDMQTAGTDDTVIAPLGIEFEYTYSSWISCIIIFCTTGIIWSVIYDSKRILCQFRAEIIWLCQCFIREPSDKRISFFRCLYEICVIKLCLIRHPEICCLIRIKSTSVDIYDNVIFFRCNVRIDGLVGKRHRLGPIHWCNRFWIFIPTSEIISFRYIANTCCGRCLGFILRKRSSERYIGYSLDLCVSIHEDDIVLYAVIPHVKVCVVSSFL